MDKLKGKGTVVTGAASCIGKAIAKAGEVADMRAKEHTTIIRSARVGRQPVVPAALLLAFAFFTTGARGQVARVEPSDGVTAPEAGDAAETAKKLANPIANLISVPFQYNHDDNIGPPDGSKDYLNIQPVIPLSLNTDWNLITRTIVPLVGLHDLPRHGDSESGLGDVLASQFFSPTKATSSGWIWGAGPVELLPTASDRDLGGGKWGLGPTFVALKQEGPLTIGFLANHVWSVAGDSDRNNVSSTFVQPFIVYITKTHTSFSLNTESTYDWRTSSWSVPINIGVAQLLKAADLALYNAKNSGRNCVRVFALKGAKPTPQTPPGDQSSAAA
jgi:hypothetical protein